MEEKNNFQRQFAVKITIHHLLSGEYIQESEDKPNYLLTKEQQPVYRLNVIAVILNKEMQGTITNFLLDDSTGKIILRAFEENTSLSQLSVGEVILIVGKLRIYNQERYISAEIIKKVDPLWLKVRSLELKSDENIDSLKNVSENSLIEDVKPKLSLSSEKEKKNDNKEKAEIEPVLEDILPTQKIIKLIKELDQGEGVSIEEVIEKSPLNDTEEILLKMLKKGDIFQNLPGKVKVL